MYFCFIIGEQCQRDSIPMVIAEQLLRWDHTVDLFEPSETITSLSDLARQSYQLAFFPALNSQAKGQLLAWTATSQEFPDTRECASPREHTRGTGVTDSLGALFLSKREGEGDLWDLPAGS